MTLHEARAMPPGLYLLFWKDGGFSEAAVGCLHDGSPWFAPTNWTSEAAAGIASCKWWLVSHVKRLPVKEPSC